MNKDLFSDIILAATTNQEEVLEKLAENDDFIVQTIVARNLNTSQKVLDVLSNSIHIHDIVKLEAVKNPNISFKSLKNIMSSYDANHPDFDESCDEEECIIGMMYCSIAEFSVNQKILNLLYEKGDVDAFLACNPNISSKILEKLSKHTHHNIRSNVANNPNTSIKTLKTLLLDKEGFIQENVKLNLIKKKNLKLFI